MKSSKKNLITLGVVQPLLEIIYEYKSSENYNYIPNFIGEKKDAWDFYEMKFNRIQSHLDSIIDLKQEQYDQINQIIMEITLFVRSYDGIHSLPKRYFKINPRLIYFHCAFDLMDEAKESFNRLRKSLPGYTPSKHERMERKKYLYNKGQLNEKYHLQHNIDDYLMQELCYTIKLLFKKIL